MSSDTAIPRGMMRCASCGVDRPSSWPIGAGNIANPPQGPKCECGSSSFHMTFYSDGHPEARADSAVPSGLALAIKFHEAYERLAPSFGYETRRETRTFDPQSANGRLMVAVCAELASAVPSSHVSDHPSVPFDRAALVDRCVQLLTRLAQWDQFNPPMTSDHGYWKGEIDALMREAVCAEPAPTTASAPANSESDHPKESKESILREALAELVALKNLKMQIHALGFGGFKAAATSTGLVWEAKKSQCDLMRADYERRKLPAWEAARSALAGMPK